MKISKEKIRKFKKNVSFFIFFKIFFNFFLLPVYYYLAEEKNMDNEILEKDYFNDLNKIKETIRQNQNKAMFYVNSQMILTYYQIGTIINERKTWGSKYIENLANDLKDYGNSYSFRNLKYMSQFTKEFEEKEIRQQVFAQIPWYTLVEISQQAVGQIIPLLYIILIRHQPGAQITLFESTKIRLQLPNQITKICQTKLRRRLRRKFLG